jgi:ABC-2 type transport system ATP-binding protein
MNILQVNNISKKYDKHIVLDNISFSIDEGEIIGFVGPNGAGKTTTIRLITNMIFPDQGSIIISGHDLFKQREKALSYISAIIENPSLYCYLTGMEHMEFIRKVNKVSNKKMKDIIDFTGLNNMIYEKIKKYSLGMKQRLALGLCLLTDPKLLLLDEPTNGLDPSGTIKLRKLLIDLANEKKTSILISSHILSEIQKMCHKILFIKDGKIIAIHDNKHFQNLQKYRIHCKDIINTEQVLKNFGFDQFSIDGNTLNIGIDKHILNDILKLLVLNNIDFDEIELIDFDIEEQYYKIYQEVQ